MATSQNMHEETLSFNQALAMTRLLAQQYRPNECFQRNFRVYTEGSDQVVSMSYGTSFIGLFVFKIRDHVVEGQELFIRPYLFRPVTIKINEMAVANFLFCAAHKFSRRSRIRFTIREGNEWLESLLLKCNFETRALRRLYYFSAPNAHGITLHKQFETKKTLDKNNLLIL